MNILMIIERFFPIIGGTESQVLLLSTNFVKRKHKTTVLTCNIGNMKKKDKKNGVNILRFSVPKNFTLMLIIFNIKLILYLLFNLHKYDIIHYFGTNHFTGIIACIAHILGKKISVKQPTPKDVDNLSKMIFGKIALNFYKYIDSFPSTSKEIRAELIKHGINESKVPIITNAVDIHKFYIPSKKEKVSLRKKLKLPLNKRIFCFTGRLVKRKGLIHLIKTWNNLLKNKNINKKIYLVLVGSGRFHPDSCEDYLINFVKDNKISETITFAGAVHNVDEYLKASDFFIFPAQKEGTSVSLLESLSCGLPTVTSNIGGIIDVVEHNKSALLTNYGDENKIKQYMEKLLKDNKLASKLRINGKKIIMDRFSSDRIAEQHLELYQKLVNGDKK